ncbi:hypothetical protein LTR20_007933 [Exophiala xenobiotica]|nr:hypothetical protein LTS13_002651 [Exophiala xenobiotica]KAK5394463.1 hypothetical protein LTR79_007913 [Exophiala xenobiotica]KAK5423602.1 hypothetical protein LTR90_000946 [Exophiala xenobiotica]KAK5459261.1 hypothetical protein LTR20_007933 [Exophiala xenobiotica]KAK5471957.1 hypothetical protein LTR26_010628 [Exophiala xenobiotica]
MSGLEIFGAVSAGAGLLSLSIQLGESAMKLRRLHKAAKDAPTTIERLLFDLETMSLALGQLEQHRRHDSHSEGLIARCIAQCQQSVQDTQQLVDKLERRLNEHPRVGGKLYTAFKERDVKELIGDLERAKSSLNLAYTMYIGVEQERRHQEHHIMLTSLQSQITVGSANISQQLTLLMPYSERSPQHPQNTPKSHPDEDNDMSLTATYGPNTLSVTTTRNSGGHCNDSELTTRASRKNGKPRLRARFAFPAWLSSRIWDFALLGAQSGWNIQFRTYNVVPYNTPVFRYAYWGDLPALRHLIDSGEASPLDVSKEYEELEDYCTLLEIKGRF